MPHRNNQRVNFRPETNQLSVLGKQRTNPTVCYNGYDDENLVSVITIVNQIEYITDMEPSHQRGVRRSAIGEVEVPSLITPPTLNAVTSNEPVDMPPPLSPISSVSSQSTTDDELVYEPQRSNRSSYTP